MLSGKGEMGFGSSDFNGITSRNGIRTGTGQEPWPGNGPLLLVCQPGYVFTTLFGLRIIQKLYTERKGFSTTMKIDPADLITQAEAARIRGVSHQTISYLRKQGRIRSFEIGGRLFVLRSEVVNYKPKPGGRPKNTTSKSPTKRRKPATQD